MISLIFLSYMPSSIALECNSISCRIGETAQFLFFDAGITQLLLFISFFFNLVILFYVFHLRKKIDTIYAASTQKSYEYSPESLSELELFIKTCILRGVDKMRIKNDLLHMGWEEKIIDYLISKHSNWSRENGLYA